MPSILYQIASTLDETATWDPFVGILANVKYILVQDPSHLFNELICAIKYSFLIISKETFIKSIDIKYFGKYAE